MGGGGNYVGTIVCVRGVLRIGRHFLMLNARPVDMVAIEWNVGLFSICYMKGCNVCKLHGGILFKFILYLVLLKCSQLE